MRSAPRAARTRSVRWGWKAAILSLLMLALLRRCVSTLLRRSLVHAVLLAAFLGGCASGPREEVGADAGTTDAPATPARSLVADGAGALRLAPLAEATLRLRLLDTAGRGVADERVSFALAGAPRSSTLRQLDATSDSDGAVSVVLVAGPMPTAFEVRATAVGAAPVLIEVSVGTEFGELEVLVRPEITRPVAAYVISTIADVPCGEITDATADGRRIGTELPSTRFTALSTGASWTVDVRGVTAAGNVVARGCIEGVRVASTAPSRTTVEVRDLPLRPDGAYAVSVVLAAAELAPGARSETLGAAVTDSGASLLLDGLHDELDALGTTDVGALRGARSAGLDERLTRELELAGASLPALLAPLADEAQAGLALFSLEATLRYGATTTLELPGALVGTTRIEGPFEASVGSVSLAATRDELLVGGVEFRVALGSTFVSAFVARAAARSPGGLPGYLRDGSACGAMLLVVTRERVLSACDAGCVRAGCVRAAGTLEARMREGARALDASHAAVRFDATVLLTDHDADLRVDETAAEGIPARWESLDGSVGANLDASWSGTRDDALE